MLRTRFIPVLQLLDGTLVKTVRFKSPRYIGDPVNTVRIFNEMEADEMCLLDIRATLGNRAPDYALLRQLSEESFCPLAYGGGIHNIEAAERIFTIGYEKVILNSALCKDTYLLSALADRYGSQALVAGIDVGKDFFGRYRVMAKSGTMRIPAEPVLLAQQLEKAGAGEILLTAIHREGTWSGYDVPLLRAVADAVSIPVIACGGAGTLAHLTDAVRSGHASAVAAGSMVVYQKEGMGVLVNMPDRRLLEEALGV